MNDGVRKITIFNKNELNRKSYVRMVENIRTFKKKTCKIKNHPKDCEVIKCNGSSTHY